MAEQSKDLVLAPGEFAYVLDITKGIVSTVVGPSTYTFTGSQYAVVWDSEKRQFTQSTDPTRARQSFVSAPQGSYVVLEAPAEDEKKAYPQEGTSSPSAPDLKFGRRVNVAGPAHFALWPRQTARVISGHQLKSNQYLVANVYDDEAARVSWGTAVVRAQSESAGEQPGADSHLPASRGIARPGHLTMGQLLIVKGTEVSFYIPPTGIEVLPEKQVFVRNAVTLERLEYCILLDEDGNKRFVTGPAVVFPEPTETFVEVNGEVKFKAMELSPISGIYVKVIADYLNDAGRHNEQKAGDELFITGKQQAIYYPRPEHSIIEYDGRKVHYAIALPEGEGRYVLNRLTGDIDLVMGPKMLLPDPRHQVVVRRILSQKTVKLVYPGNDQALKANAELEAINRELPAGAHFTQEAADQVRMRFAAKGAAADFASESFQRGTSYTPPRTITLDTKYDGAVRVDIWTGYAVLITDSTGHRRVVVGPKTILLEYDENLASMELSTGTPKSDDKTVQTVYLRVLNNRVSDKVEVETSDLCKVSLTLSYRVNFEGDDHERWFAVENYVKFLTEHLRSLIRNIARQHGVEKFYKDAISIVRDAILGFQQDGRRPGRSFSENEMRVYDVEVLDVKIENNEIAKLLVDAQHSTFKAALMVAAAERELANTLRTEAAKRGTAEEKATTVKLEKELETKNVAHTLAVNLATIEAEARKTTEQNDSRLAQQSVLDKIKKAELARTKLESDRQLEDARRRIEQELFGLKGETDEYVRRTGAVSPDLIVALQAFGDKDLIEKAAKAMAPLAILGGTSVVDVLNKFLEGTPLKDVLGKFGARDGNSPRAERAVRD